jgi:hypothetical protein
MIVPDFSEFSFGYALTDNLIHGFLRDVKGVPTFPSLIEEGKAGIGYDIEIPRFSAPLFLQFKLPQVVPRHRNVWGHDLTPLYYRVHLMRTSESTQHQSLLDLANKGKMVFYVAPEFHEREQLNRFYNLGRVPSQSAFFDPKDIGALDEECHHIAYKPEVDNGWFCSKARRLSHPQNSHYFLKQITQAVTQANRIEDSIKFFEALIEDILITALEAEVDRTESGDLEYDTPKLFGPPQDAWFVNEKRKLEPLRKKLGVGKLAGYLSRFYFDAELLIVGRGELCDVKPPAAAKTFERPIRKFSFDD